MRGTAAEDAVQEARNAVRDYRVRCLTLWQEIRDGLESECGLATYPYPERDQRTKGPHLTHLLVHLLYKGLWCGTLPPHPPFAEWLKWGRPENKPANLIAQTMTVAVGSETDHQRIKRKTEEFLDRNLEDLRGRATGLTRLHQDLQYLRHIVRETLGNVVPEDVRRGICPACPYPEMEED